MLIIGGTGSLGMALVESFYHTDNITVVSRDPHKQAQLLLRYPRVKTILADIRSPDAMRRCVQGQDVVIMAAALKHVNAGESNPREFYEVNVNGTVNVADAILKSDVRRAIFISTDKAVQPVNLYGKTKALAETLWLSSSTSDGSSHQFSVVRYGNVIDSRGSLLEVWKNRSRAGLPIEVRSPRPTRFFLTLHDAVVIVKQSLKYMLGGDILVPNNLKAFDVWDLAKCFQQKSKWRITRLGPTEKQHEVLVAPTEYTVVIANSYLSRVLPAMSKPSQSIPREFCSLSAPRISGAEVLKIVQATQEGINHDLHCRTRN